MKKLMLLAMLLLAVCSSAFAESLDDVLKDCRLDKNRWIFVEWSKAEKFVRFYDSDSVSVTGPGRFDATVSDYYYGAACRNDNCAQRGSRHYHTEKWGFDSTGSAGTLRSFSTEDANGNTVDSYDYPAGMQIETGIKNKSIEAKTMSAISGTLKGNKEFTAVRKPTPAPDSRPKNAAPEVRGLVPMPMAIGTSAEGWVYLGRFTAPAYFSSFSEWETRMYRYTGNAEANNLYDVYYYHSHYGNGDGEGCYMVGSQNGPWHYGFACVVKCVPLDKNARPKHLSGLDHGIVLLSMAGGSKGIFSALVKKVRIFDSATNQLLADVTSEQNPKINGSFRDYEASALQYRNNSPFYIAMHMTTSCPVKPNPIP